MKTIALTRRFRLLAWLAACLSAAMIAGMVAVGVVFQTRSKIEEVRRTLDALNKENESLGKLTLDLPIHLRLAGIARQIGEHAVILKTGSPEAPGP